LILPNVPPHPHNHNNSDNNENSQTKNNPLPFLLSLPLGKLALGNYALGFLRLLFSQA
jgi:hypothetical protein